MSKQELIEAIAAKSGLTQADSSRALGAFIEVVTGTLKKGDKVTLTGFGVFSVSKREARNGRNPRTGEVVKIAASNSVKFKTGSKLKEAINK
ncbi:MAG: HU family DNA-binding protein [Bacilli bacterium]|nr:HU family DNA-binding protein [Bacilli bacterium]